MRGSQKRLLYDFSSFYNILFDKMAQQTMNNFIAIYDFIEVTRIMQILRLYPETVYCYIAFFTVGI